jgi:glutathione-regulated potassium-efflux system ancillary protein KefC
VRLRELFTSLALLLVVGMSLLMQSLEISMGLGAFLAGLLLADSEYKHSIEADIEPFKGLLLGLFFISVGMSVQSSDILAQPGIVLLAVLGTLLLKVAIHLVLAHVFRLPAAQAPFFSLSIAQVGEFAFVLFGAAVSLGILGEGERGQLVAVSALSFAASSVAVKVYDLTLARYFEGAAAAEPDEIESDGAPVIIAGFGRVGQIVGRFLFANGIKATVLDFEANQVESLRRFGFKVFYGDATRDDLLEAAGAKDAKLLVVAIDEVEASLALVDVAQKHFPHLRLICRARNVAHVFELRARGVELLERETFDGALRLGRKVLEHFGTAPYQAFSLAQKFRAFDHALMDSLVEERANEKSRISLAQQARLDIERLFAEEDERIRRGDEGWGGYVDI